MTTTEVGATTITKVGAKATTTITKVVGVIPTTKVGATTPSDTVDMAATVTGVTTGNP